ncbi:3130_t:CDS:2 [Acaulospora morrowiae]|uniref:3130_t:CDS:1 n=1 Tax=Acaulospora morrowiae TaxID=94023 RepID=A0A9N9C378_9GLOM|nr:3130_t:CDS:2 [Acaulospora morrowiae]
MAFKTSQLFMFLLVVVFCLSFNIDSYYSRPLPRQAGTFNGDATFYDVGLGACGITSQNTQFVCAIPQSQFDPSPNGNPNLNPHCGRQVQVTRGSKSVVVTVVDRCVGCGFNDIDLSPTAFDQIADPAEGRVKVSWCYI